jgi:hypothetical protein
MNLRLSSVARPSVSGNALLLVVILGGIMTLTIGSTIKLSTSFLRNAHGRSDWNAAFFHAENAMQWAAQGIADVRPASASSQFTTADGTLTVPYMADARANPLSGFKNAWVSVNVTNAALPNIFLIKASARVGDKVRTIQAVVTKNPAGGIFDYEYFLNNWGWWWGNSITGNGGNRANWDFDFRSFPVVNGLILANGNITQNNVPVNQLALNPPFAGQAGASPVDLAHMGVPRLLMPNLQDLSYYKTKALTDTRTNGLWLGSTQMVAGVHSDAAQPGLYLVGTDAQPIVISNTVVIEGDVVIKGKMTGRGTLYVGGNLYVSGDLTYKNGPNWASPPETMAPTQRDQWVLNSQNKDLIGLAVRGSILAGDVNSSDWKTCCFDPADYGLSKVNDESKLGADGIAHTGDDNIPFLHADGTTSTGYDADENGTIDGNFNYSTQITMTSARAGKIKDYPTDASNVPVAYNTVASNDMNLLDGIFYTNHAAAMRLARNNAVFHGVIVSRNEAIIFNGHLTFNYDSRVHSRYNDDPNRFVDLCLPAAGALRLDKFAELPPDSTNL